MTLVPLFRTALIAGLLAASSAAHAQIDPIRQDTGAVGVTSEQYIRLNAWFVRGQDGELPPGPCRITLRFYDTRGAIVAESTEELVPSRATLLDYRPAGLAPGERMTVRAEIIAEPDRNGVTPPVLPSVEVIDVATGRTAVVDPGSSSALEPTRADFSTFGMTHLQVARLSATCLGHVDDRGLPPGPCRMQLAIVSGNGRALVTREVTSAAGETVSLDFAAGEMVTGVRRRMWATVSTDEASFVATSVEIFDQPTGKTVALLPGQIAQSWGWE